MWCVFLTSLVLVSTLPFPYLSIFFTLAFFKGKQRNPTSRCFVSCGTRLALLIQPSANCFSLPRTEVCVLLFPRSKLVLRLDGPRSGIYNSSVPTVILISGSISDRGNADSAAVRSLTSEDTL